VVQFEDILRRFNYQPGHLIQRKFSLKWKEMKDFLPRYCAPEPADTY
jgi:hypothetical protein